MSHRDVSPCVILKVQSSPCPVTPFAKLDAYAQLAIDLVVVSAGVEASITIIDVSLPFSATLDFTGGVGLPKLNNLVGYLSKDEDFNIDNAGLLVNGGITLDTNLDLLLRTLDGRVSLFAKVNLGFYKKTFRKKLAEWDGFKYDANLFNYKLELGKQLEYKIPIWFWDKAGNLGEVELPST